MPVLLIGLDVQNVCIILIALVVIMYNCESENVFGGTVPCNVDQCIQQDKGKIL